MTSPGPLVTDELKNRLGRLDEATEAGRPTRRSGRGIGLYVVGGLLILLGGLGLYWYWQVSRTGEDWRNLEFQPAAKGKIVFTIVEKGELEAAKNVEITCRVRSSGRGNSVASTIKWVIDDGTRVRKGDLLMQLDDAGIKEQIKNQQGVVVTALGNKTDAEKNLDIVRIENESNIKMARNNVEIAKLDLEKYIKGDLEKGRKEVFGQITLKESELLQSKDRVGWSSRMVRKGYLSESQARVDEFKLRSSEIDLDRLVEQRRVLDDYESQRQILDFKNKLEQAVMAEKVAKTTADSKLVQAETKLNVALTTLNQEQLKLDELLEDLRNCRIVAPSDGMVVYYIPEQSRFGGGSQQSTIAVGEPVREGQKLMRIPDLRRMLVRVKIHESLIPRLQADVMRRTGFSERLHATAFFGLNPYGRLLFAAVWPEFLPLFADADEEVGEDGLPCYVKLASIERPVTGHLKFVSPVASSTDWMSSDVKVYQCLVRIDEAVENLKPGMSAEVTVIVDERDNVLRLPVQAVLESAGQKFCYVRDKDKIAKRKLVTGLNNSKFVEILAESELKEGEEVLLNARQYAEKQDDLKASGSAEINTKNPNFRQSNGTRTRPTATAPQTTSPAPRTRPTGTRAGRQGGGGSGGPPAWFSQLTPAQQGEMMTIFPKLGDASPQERKKLIDGLSVPKNIKDEIKKGMKERGLEIAD